MRVTAAVAMVGLLAFGSGCDIVEPESAVEEGVVAGYSVAAGPTMSLDYVCEVLTCTFTDRTRVSATRSWRFYDLFGTRLYTTEGNSVRYAFPREGMYVVALMVRMPNGKRRRLIRSFMVPNTGPTAAQQADFTYEANGLEVSFTNTSVGTFGQKWDLGDGARSTEVAPVHTYSSEGTYDVTLVVRVLDSDERAYVTKQVVVGESVPPVTADFSFGVVGRTVSFTNLSTGAETFVWSFGDLSSSTETDPVHTYSASGLYEVTLTALGQTTASITKLVEVADEPPPDGLPPGGDTDVPTAIDTGDEGEQTPGSYKGLPQRLVDNGEPVVSDHDGTIGVVCIGMSNANRECHWYAKEFLPNVSGNPQVKFVNCAVGGRALESWIDPEEDEATWKACVDSRLGNQAGITAADVRVIYHKAADKCAASTPGDLCAFVEADALPPYPDPSSDYFNYIDNLDAFSLRVKEFFPNVQAVYTTSRSYGGYATFDVRGEPLSYEEGHALNTWLTANPIVDGVWYGWGPYVWAPDCGTGLTNGSGICYTRDDYASDGFHPADGANSKIAQMLHDRFSQHAWYP